jgi:hypothetical protein
MKNRRALSINTSKWLTDCSHFTNFQYRRFGTDTEMETRCSNTQDSCCQLTPLPEQVDCQTPTDLQTLVYKLTLAVRQNHTSVAQF